MNKHVSEGIKYVIRKISQNDQRYLIYSNTQLRFKFIDYLLISIMFVGDIDIEQEFGGGENIEFGGGINIGGGINRSLVGVYTLKRNVMGFGVTQRREYCITKI